MYSVQEIAKMWKLSDRRVREMCAKGQIPNVQKVGKSYLIPETAVRPEKREFVKLEKHNEICIVCKDNENLMASALAYNFYRNDIVVDVTVPLSKIDKKINFNVVDLKSMHKNTTTATYKCVIFVDWIDKAIVNSQKGAHFVYISKNSIKNNSVNQIVGYLLEDKANLTRLALSLYCVEGVLKQVYDIVCDIIDGKYVIPMLFNFNNQKYEPRLFYELPTIQKSYDFLSRQYDSFENDDEFYTLIMGNSVEYSDSNQELDYAVGILNALKRNVSAKFIYLYDKSILKTIVRHFTTKAYLQNINGKSAFYMIEKSKVDKRILKEIGEGVILYKNEGVYHDKITEYSLGYVNATIQDIEKYQKIVEELLPMCTKITTEKQMEDFYELQK